MTSRLLIGGLLAAMATGAVAQPVPPVPPAPPIAPAPPLVAPGTPPAPRAPRPAQTRAEAIGRAQEMFTRLDTNHDGAITQDELAAIAGGGAGAPGGRGMGGGGMLMMADTNRDGRVTLDELTAAAVARFDRMDLNHDGVLAPEERAQARAQWSAGRPGE